MRRRAHWATALAMSCIVVIIARLSVAGPTWPDCLLALALMACVVVAWRADTRTETLRRHLLQTS